MSVFIDFDGKPLTEENYVLYRVGSHHDFDRVGILEKISVNGLHRIKKIFPMPIDTRDVYKLSTNIKMVTEEDAFLKILEKA